MSCDAVSVGDRQTESPPCQADENSAISDVRSKNLIADVVKERSRMSLETNWLEFHCASGASRS